jgi:hypothetical protein
MKFSFFLRTSLLLAPLILISSSFADLPFKVYKEDLDMYPPQPYPVRDTIEIGGFRIVVNRLQLGYTIYKKAENNILGNLSGNDYDVTIFRVPAPHTPLEKVAEEMDSQLHGYITISKVRTRFGEGIKTSYGKKPSIFSDNIIEMSYFFVNKSGEIICFEGRAKKLGVDWTYFTYLMTDRTVFAP